MIHFLKRQQKERQQINWRQKYESAAKQALFERNRADTHQKLSGENYVLAEQRLREVQRMHDIIAAKNKSIHRLGRVNLICIALILIQAGVVIWNAM